MFLVIGIIAVLVVVISGGVFGYRYFSSQIEWQNIQNYFDKNAYYGNLAIDTNNPSICPEFGSAVCKYFIFMWHTNICSNIPINKPIFGSDKDQATFQDLDKKQECVKKIAIDTKNAELCGNLFDQTADCQNAVAIALNDQSDPSKCSDYGDCEMKIAIDKKDIAICENKYDKAWCIVAFPKLLQESSTGQPYDQSCYRPPISIETTGYYEVKNNYIFPNTYDAGINDYPTQITTKLNFNHLLSIPFNNSNNLLRVYTNSNNDIALLRLVKYSISSGISELLGDIRSETGANWGGIYIPIAISKDDKHIIFKAYMGSPGSGGGSVTLGYAYSSLASDKFDTCGYLAPHKIADAAYFYDNFSKSLFLIEENNVPASEKPGPDYDSAIKFINVTTGETKTLLEEPNTIYEITKINEESRVVNFESCPWQKYRFNCSSFEISTQSRSINLP